MNKYNKSAIIMLMVLLISAISVFAEGPQGLNPADVTNTSERFDSESWNPYNISALAGNITSMNIHAWTQTRTWAGFYGNISGTIVLSDTNNNTLYDWNDADPAGKVYASRDPLVNWSNIQCATLSELSVGEAQFSGTNETDRNDKYPMDAPNRTFIDPDLVYVGVEAQSALFTDYPLIYVGPVDIDPSTCPSTSLHNENGSYVDYVKGSQNAGNDQNRFRELVLSDGVDIVYTTILEKNWIGFDNNTHDFQMIVPEDGHGTDTVVTQYYFYVELE